MTFIFDVGGVLTNNLPLFTLIPQALNISKDQWEYFLGPKWEDGIKNSTNPFKTNLYLELTKGKITTKEFWKLFEERSHIKTQDDLWKRFFDPVRNIEVYRIIEKLKKKSRVIGGTNTISDHYDIHMQKDDYDIFDKTYASQILGEAKPFLSFWKKILNEENIDAKDAFFIDDRQTNIKAAASLGLHVHHFTDAQKLMTVLRDFF